MILLIECLAKTFLNRMNQVFVEFSENPDFVVVTIKIVNFRALSGLVLLSEELILRVHLLISELLHVVLHLVVNHHWLVLLVSILVRDGRENGLRNNLVVRSHRLGLNNLLRHWLHLLRHGHDYGLRWRHILLVNLLSKSLLKLLKRSL